MWRQWRIPGAAPRLVLMAATSSATLLLFFFALRSTGVAVAMFLLFLMPVWVALLAPRLLRTPPEPAAAPALALAVGGLVLILVPELAGGSLRVSVWGLAAGLASGFGYTAYALLVKDLTRRVAASTIALAETGLDVLFVLPLALWQLSVTGYRLTPSDLVVLLVLGLVCTSLAYMLWTEGTRRVRVEHVSVLGYLEPVSAPLYALLLLGERPGGWVLAGGALIIVAGLIVVRYGSAEAEPI
jgi:drug/metabolite transporter (DMT)-like permease